MKTGLLPLLLSASLGLALLLIAQPPATGPGVLEAGVGNVTTGALGALGVNGVNGVSQGAREPATTPRPLELPPPTGLAGCLLDMVDPVPLPEDHLDSYRSQLQVGSEGAGGDGEGLLDRRRVDRLLDLELRIEAWGRLLKSGSVS